MQFTQTQKNKLKNVVGTINEAVELGPLDKKLMSKHGAKTASKKEESMFKGKRPAYQRTFKFKHGGSMKEYELTAYQKGSSTLLQTYITERGFFYFNIGGNNMESLEKMKDKDLKSIIAYWNEINGY